MAAIIGLVGSPRKDKGRTYELVSEVLAGVHEVGLETRLEFLADWPVQPCQDCGAPCFATGKCALSKEVTELTELVNQADGLVLGAPVYIWQVNGLTHAFMDRYRIPGGAALYRRPNGKPALAVAVAGGTGTGISGAIRSLQDFLCIWGYRPLPPVAATRYNMEQALAAARVAGKMLAQSNILPQPLAGLPEALPYFQKVQFSCQDHLDELIWLARLAANLGNADYKTVLQLCSEAEAIRDANLSAAVEKALNAFELARGRL